MNKSKVILIQIGTILLVSCHSQEIKPDAPIFELPSSTEVLSKAAEAYKNLSSYQDEGVCVTKFKRVIPLPTTEKHFATAYSKSGNFRFEFWELGAIGSEARYVVWRDGNDVKSWWTVNPKVESHRNLGSAISGATGVSSETAYTIPSVLINEAAWKGSTWTSSTHTYRIQDAVDRGTTCYRIQRLRSSAAEKIGSIETPATKGKVTYWVSKSNFLLIRIDKETDFGTFLASDTVTYSPKINTTIPSSAFTFGH